jgi:hypothetical protein
LPYTSFVDHHGENRKATSLARKDTAAREDTAAHEATSSARKDTAARKDSAAPQGGSEKFSGERKGPPEAIVPAPVAHKDTASHGGSEKFIGERKGPPEAIVPAPEAIVPRLPPMPTLVGIDFAAAGDDFAAAVPSASRRYPGSNNGEYYEMGGEESKTGGFFPDDEDTDIMAGEEGNNGGEDYDNNEDYDSVPDDDGDNSRDKDYVPKLFESSDDDDFDHLNDDDINEEDRRIENMYSKSRILTGRHRGNLIMGGPVVPNYKFMSASKASDARSEYQTLRKKYRDGIRRERLRGNKGSSFDELDYTGDLTPTLRPMTLVLLARLQLGQTIPESDLIKLRIAEEANHRGIYFSVHKSDEI